MHVIKSYTNNLKNNNLTKVQLLCLYTFIRESKLKLHSKHDEYLTMLKILNDTDTFACLWKILSRLYLI